MSALPDLSPYCEAVAIKIWGAPQLRTPKQLRWGCSNGYGGRTLDLNKGVWFDRDHDRGGSTLELIAYAKGLPKEKIRGKLYWDIRSRERNGAVELPRQERLKLGDKVRVVGPAAASPFRREWFPDPDHEPR